MPYFQIDTFLKGIWTNIWVTILLLIATYTLLNLSRVIINFFEKIVTPIVYQFTDKGTVVLKTEYKKLEEEKEKLEKRLEKERDSRLKVQAERDSLESRIIESINKENQPKNEESILEDDSKSIAVAEKVISKIDSIYSMVESRKMLDLFKQVIDAIEAGRSLVDNEEYVKYFLRLGLIKKKAAYSGGRSTYTFTDKGRELWDLLIEKKEI